MQGLRALLMLIGALALLPGTGQRAGAHPYAWIDVTTEVLFDAEGRLTGLKQHWLFDEFYTAFVLEGLPLDASGQPPAETIAAVVDENMANLVPYGWFTRIEAEGARQDLTAGKAASELRGNRLQMSFTVSLAEPLDVRGRSFSYAVFDPTYYIEMLHAEVPDPIMLRGAPPGCIFRVDQPQPTVEALATASMLDRTQSAGDGLGIHFAETVTITCAPAS